MSSTSENPNGTGKDKSSVSKDGAKRGIATGNIARATARIDAKRVSARASAT